jgi:hypothetical protein
MAQQHQPGQLLMQLLVRQTLVVVVVVAVKMFLVVVVLLDWVRLAVAVLSSSAIQTHS